MRKSYSWHVCEIAFSGATQLEFSSSWKAHQDDENLSDRIIYQIRDLYPASEHIKTLSLIQSEDVMIWQYAKVNDFVIVSKDSDFHQRGILYGHPPKIIYLRVGNCPASKIVHILRENYDMISQFGSAEEESILVLS